MTSERYASFISHANTSTSGDVEIRFDRSIGFHEASSEMPGRPQDLVVLQHCIENSIRRHHGAMPRDVTLVWEGYLAALSDQELLSEEEYDQARVLLPKLPDNPTDGIFTTWLDRWDDSPWGG
jgi:hypothetical protein